jgi:predicted nucleic acid-binding protein
MQEIFLDTAYAIALSAQSDEHHQTALALAEELEADEIRLVTTRAVIIEIGNALSKRRYRKAATELLDSLEEDTSIEIVPITEQLYYKAYKLYRERPDKEWGLTDCLSFVVMKERGINQALTTDGHFEQAGFEILLS